MPDKNNQQDEGQIILVDKPVRWTSFDVVKKVRYKLQIKKVGHAGTLDPLATGLLILCTGKKTKQIEQFMNLEKEYEGRIVIGKTTPSFDLETEFDSETKWEHITADQCLKAAAELTGAIEQVPPAHSAIRVKGKRAYKMARKGEEVIMKSRKVVVTAFTLPMINLPEIHFKVICSRGTYIRSLARDFGNILGPGAYLAELRRTRIGQYHVEDALSIDKLSTQA